MLHVSLSPCRYFLASTVFMSLVCFFFFFKQKTAYEMRISDWSSDVCSSDLHHRGEIDDRPLHAGQRRCVVDQDGAGLASQGAAADAVRRAGSGAATGNLAVLSEHRNAAVDSWPEPSAPRRRQCVRLRRDRKSVG